MSASTIAGRTGYPGGRVPPTLQYPGGTSHGKCGDRFSTIATKQGSRHLGDRDDRVSSTACLRCRRLRERRQKGSFPRWRTGPFSTAFAQSSHLFVINSIGVTLTATSIMLLSYHYERGKVNSLKRKFVKNISIVTCPIYIFKNLPIHIKKN